VFLLGLIIYHLQFSGDLFLEHFLKEICICKLTNSKYVNKTKQNPKQVQLHLLQNVPKDLPDLLPKNR